jgi:hypothetical protein
VTICTLAYDYVNQPQQNHPAAHLGLRP